MDNRRRPGRSHGHAVLAAQARRALGVREGHHLADVPLPLVHAALGLAACALALLVRVPVLGMLRGSLASLAVALATGAVLLAYDRLVLPEDRRPAVDGAALPVAAVGAFAILLATSTSLWLRLAAALVTAAVIGGVPHVGQRELAGHHDPRLRFIHDVAGIVVAVPYVFAGGAAATLELPARMLIVAAGCGLLAFDGLRVDAVPRRIAEFGGIFCGLGVAVAAGFAPALTQGGGPGLRAGLLILVWYGLRGSVASLAAGRRGVVMMLEYLGFVMGALLALAWVGQGLGR